MKILIPTIGSRGDVQPFIALAQGLSRAGHTPRLATHPIMKDLVESHGVAFAPIGADIDLGREVAFIRQRAGNAASGLMQSMRFAFEMLEQSHDDILALCRTVELVVVPAASAAGKNEADQLEMPYLSVSLMPWGIPWDDPKRPLLKRMLYRAIDRMISQITTKPLNRMRKGLGLAPVGREGFTSLRLNLIPVSPLVYASNPCWEPHHHLTGYWFVDEQERWQPPSELLSFLEDGEPPLLVSLGTMSLGEGDSLKTASLFIEAIQQAQVRAIVQGWNEVIEQLVLPSSIYYAGSVPHSWLMPRCKGAVHHGGFGTTSACFRAGIPALVIPHIADQFYWGQRAYELGVGVKPIRRTALDGESLTAALVELAGADDLRLAASHLGEQIRVEKGVDTAVHLIEETFNG